MATNIKHTLLNLEIPPPPGVWPDIAARLNTEFDAEEVPVAQKMFDLSVTPPAAAWEQIAAHLPQQQIARKEGKLISLSVRKTIAAAAMVMLTLGAWYFLDKTNNNEEHNVAGKATTTSPVDKNATAHIRTPAADTEIGEQSAESPLVHKPIASLSVADAGIINAHYSNRSHARRAPWFDYQPIATSYAGMDDVQAVQFTETNSPAIEAPLIRDANGQVIMDKKLITSPDDCYITITSPNGEQTRISSKFLHIISTLNENVEPQDYFDFMMQENSLWKIRFSEWKEKFMTQASLVPTATSFTDILELKDLLMENQ